MLADSMNDFYEEVYNIYYDTANNFHWTGTRTGEHVVRWNNSDNFKKIPEFGLVSYWLRTVELYQTILRKNLEE